MFSKFFLLAAVVISSVAAYGDIQVDDEPDTSCVSRPCCLEDINCIRHVFYKRGLCDKVKKYPFKNKEFHVDNIIIEQPYLNVTLQQNATFRGIETGSVAEFYINKKTDVILFSTKFTNVTIEGDLLVHQHRKLKEDRVIHHQSYEEYSCIYATTTIPSGKCFRDNIKTYAYITARPYYFLGDRCSIKGDDVKNIYNTVFDQSDVVSSTSLGPRTAILQLAFIENIICCK